MNLSKMFNCQLNIKLGQFTEEELDVVSTKIKSRKKNCRSGRNVHSVEWKTRKFSDINSSIMQRNL